MLKKVLALVIVLTSAVSCASWFTSSQENPDSPVVGGRQDSSDMLFGQAESSPVAPAASAPINASAPVTNTNSLK